MSLVTSLKTLLASDSDVTDVFKTIAVTRIEEALAWSDETDFDALLVDQGNEQAQPNEHDGYVVNYTTSEIHVMVVTKFDNLDERKQLVRDKVLGYQHAAKYSLLEFTDGQIVHQHGEYIFWVDTYTTSYELRQSV